VINLDGKLSYKNQDKIMELLQAEFSPEKIQWRVVEVNDNGKGLALPYIKKWAILERLNKVLTPFGWRSEVRQSVSPRSVTVCIAVRFHEPDNSVHWVKKCDCVECPDDDPIKGGIASAFRRAAAQWGIGLYLYSLPLLWVDVEKVEYGFCPTKEEYSRLNEFLLTKKWSEAKPPVQSGKPNDAEETGTVRMATEGQKNCILKNLHKFDIREEDVPNLTFDEADALIKSMRKEHQERQERKVKENEENSTADNGANNLTGDTPINAGQKGIMEGVINEVAIAKKVNTDNIRNIICSKFNISKVEALPQTMFTPAINYLKNLLLNEN
jgi:hypothetical protein